MSAHSIDEVIDALDAIVALSRQNADRVGYFAALYRKVTVAVRDGIRRGEFLDGDRMDRLDTRFANRYLDALDAYRAGKPVSESWRISLDACRDKEPTILQHLYSGLSAHLLLDLAVAAAETAPGARLADIRGDFEHINQIVGRLMREVDGIVGKVSPWIGLIDRMAGVQYAAVNKIGISVARDLAWRSAVELAPLDELARSSVISTLDRRAALVARTLTRPTAGLRVVARLIRARESDDVALVIGALAGTKPAPRPVTRKRVAVLGGGIGGLTAAHELIERGFEVDVYEAKSEAGGKASSQFVAGTGTGGRKDLPGEHGFRFYPSFYRHVIDSMGRVPVPGGSNVAARIKSSDEMGMMEGGDRSFVFERHPPRQLGDFFQITKVIGDFFGKTKVREQDVARFSHAMLRFMVSCDERRIGEYEKMSFWDFVGADQCDPSFRKYVYTTRFMVAMDPKNGSARTVASKGIQILADFARNNTRTDGVLDGPTTERWIEPWTQELTKKGVRFHYDAPVTDLLLADSRTRLSGVRVAGQLVSADHYVLSVPLDVAQTLVTDELAAVDPALAGVRRLQSSMSSMVGAQFFFSKPVPICRGHVAYPDAPWALSSISQGQFWADGVAGYGDGTVQDILSVDISDWNTIAPRLGRAARDCTKEEVLDEVWAQLADALGTRIDRASLVARHLDRNVFFTPGEPARNTTPLLVHPPGSYFDRPGADVRIENLFLASDYVKTNTDLASMEGANEAGRRAVNAILDAEGSSAVPCAIWGMGDDLGPLVDVAKRLDRDLYLLESGRPSALPFGGALGMLRSHPPPDNLGVMREIEDALVSALRLIASR